MNEQTGSRDWSQHWAFGSSLGLSVDRVDARDYTSQAVFDAECERIFRRAWIPVARENEAPAPGDFVRCEIPPLKTQALIARDREGTLHAFHNACQHRGAAIVSECKGKSGAFVCPYHAWTYDLNGMLKAIPGRDYFPQVDSARTRLKPIHMEVWNGFVFLNFGEQPEQKLTEFLGDFAALFETLPFNDYPHVIEMVRDIDANWKAGVEASSEGYHVSVLHRASLGDQMTGAGNPLNNYYDAVISGPHATATVQANPDWRPDQPVANFVYATEAFRAQPGGRLDDMASRAGPMPFTAHPSVNRIGLPAVASESILLFPFTCIQMLPDRYFWFQYWPVAPHRTRFVLRVYTQSPPSSYREAFAEAYMTAYSRDIVTEDSRMLAMQQCGFASGGIEQTVLGENEWMLRFFNQTRKDFLTKDQETRSAS